MKTKDKLRIAIIGLGEVTRNIHLPAYTNLGDVVDVVGGCDINQTARQIFQKKTRVREVFDDPCRMIAETMPDIVTVCTPPSLHVEHTFTALESGCHVFCEKPVAENLAEAKKIARCARQANRFVVVNNQFPYMNIHRAAKQLINSPEFGKLLFLQAWQTLRPPVESPASWRYHLRQKLCFEFGTHVFELARYFFEAEPIKIFAQMPKPKIENFSDTLNLISLEFADGRAASIILNRLSQGPEKYLDMRLDGEFASIHTSIGGKFGLEAGIHTNRKRPFLGFNFIKGGSAVLQNGNQSKIIAKDGINPFASATAYHLGNFIKALKTNAIPRGEIDDNLKTLALVFAAYASNENNCAINMSEFTVSQHNH